MNKLYGGGNGQRLMYFAGYTIIGILYLVLFGIFMMAPGDNLKGAIWTSYAVGVVLFIASIGLAYMHQPIFSTMAACGMGFGLWTAYIWTIGAENLPKDDKSRPYLFLAGAIMSGLAMGYLMQKIAKSDPLGNLMSGVAMNAVMGNPMGALNSIMNNNPISNTINNPTGNSISNSLAQYGQNAMDIIKMIKNK